MTAGGTRPPHIRFSDAEALAILKALDGGMSVRRAAKVWRCSENTLRAMRAGRTYGWLRQTAQTERGE